MKDFKGASSPDAGVPTSLAALLGAGDTEERRRRPRIDAAVLGAASSAAAGAVAAAGVWATDWRRRAVRAVLAAPAMPGTSAPAASAAAGATEALLVARCEAMPSCDGSALLTDMAPLLAWKHPSSAGQPSTLASASECYVQSKLC